ncbi:PREDICTED: MAR-binding filament-like protein 1-1 isoform X1 [Lupinus angustifolius]|nr:PREDICTED: MAR-binding filament-like protein 1-1 isoform X1 [Lupinus angustifolius]
MMGFVSVGKGSSCFLHSLPLCEFQHTHTNLNFKTNFRTSITSSSLRSHQNQRHGAFCNTKRSFLFMGIAFFPFPPFQPSLATPKESEVKKTPQDNQKVEETSPEMDRPSNSFPSLLDGIGILSSGVVGAFYAFSQKEKSAALATIETMSSKLKEKKELMVSLKRNYESKLLNEQEERAKLLGKAREEQQALTKQLNSANSTIARFGEELKSEKSLIEEMKLQIDSLEIELSETGADKKGLENKLKDSIVSIGILQKRIVVLSSDIKDKEDVVQNINSALDEKELELRNLNSAYEQTKDDLSNVHLQIQGLTDELLKSQEEIKAKDSLVEELNSRVSYLNLENNDSRIKYDVLKKEYNDLELTSEKKAALDAKVLMEREEELCELKDQLVLVLNEASRNQSITADLAQEREILMESLENETNKANNLMYELQITEENLGISRNESAELEKQLNESNKLQKELELEVSKLSSELTEVRESLQSSLDDAKHSAEMLTTDLATAKENLKEAEAELRSMSNELTAACENRDSLQRELIVIYKKAEVTAEDLKKEKELVASLTKDVQTLETQLSEDNEAKRSLEIDLEEATKSLDEMNRNAFILSGELESSNSIISSLENEKLMLYNSLIEQRNACKVAQENMEDAHNLITRIGRERGNLENRGKKLEEELASAKGEILRLRSRIKSSKVAINNEQVQKDEGERKVTVSARKSSKKRNANPQ